MKPDLRRVLEVLYLYSDRPFKVPAVAAGIN